MAVVEQQSSNAGVVIIITISSSSMDAHHLQRDDARYPLVIECKRSAA
jgi:hypothetical protein